VSHRNVLCSWLVWLFATRTFKLLPHLWSRPQDIIHVPAFVLFCYYFAIMKIYALFTLHEVSDGPSIPWNLANWICRSVGRLGDPRRYR